VDELELELAHGARAVFTSRADGDLRGDASARERLARRIGVAPVRHGRQVHGADLALDGDRDEADAQVVTAGAGMVLVADCLPIAIAGPDAVAAVHAGWRGLAGGVVARSASAVGDGRLEAAIGPGIGPCCFEVGDEVRDAFSEHAAAAFTGRHVDLKAIARRELRAAGVDEVSDVGICTVCDERFFSHRGEGPHTGRQAGVVWRS